MNISNNMFGFHLMIVVNDAGFFLSHRLPIAKQAIVLGAKVSLICPPSQHIKTIENEGIAVIELPLVRGSSSLVSELSAFLKLFKVIKSKKPDLIHAITAKPIIMAGAIARLIDIPLVSAISGLGHVFIDQHWRTRLIRYLVVSGYKLALNRNLAHTIFQNSDNIDLFRESGISVEPFDIIPGSGTDLLSFDPTRSSNVRLQVNLPARMLRTKGVYEFVEAARILSREQVAADFMLTGDPDPANPASVSKAQLETWSAEGVVQWQPHRADIENVIHSSDIIVLPSYNEGFPKTIIDASAGGRPVVTTNVTGCRDAIIPNETGLLVDKGDAKDLAAKILILIADDKLRLAMGERARLHAAENFSIDYVVDQHMQIYNKSLGRLS